MRGEPADHGEVLFDQQHRDGLGGAFQHLGDLGDDLRGEALGRLVGDDQLVAVEQRAADGHHLLLAAGERAGRLSGAPEQFGEELVDERVVGLPVAAFGQAQVLRDGQPREDAPVLGGIADAPADEGVRGQLHRLLAVQQHAAGARHQAEDAAHGGGLARTVAAEQGGDPVRCDVEVHAVQDVPSADQDPQAADGEQRTAVRCGAGGGDGPCRPAGVHRAAPR